MPEIHARTCHLCEANCGVLIEVEGREVLSVKGNPDHVLSEGYICPKATAIPDIQNDPDRLKKPLKKVDGDWQEIDWDTAYREIAERVVKITSGHKRASLYMGNPNTHIYSTTTQMRKFYKALGLRGLYSASTLDQLPHMIMQRWVYGHNALYAVPDIDRTQYMLIVGGNPLASNGSLWTVPNVRKRLKRVQERGGKIVVVDPRRTETAKVADTHHFIKPSTDTALFLGILLALDEAGLVKPGRLSDMLDAGWKTAWNDFRQFDLANLSEFCGISVADIRQIAADLGSGEPTICYGRMGVSVTEFGTLNHYLIAMINIATGNLDREGGVMFGLPLVDPVERSGTGSYNRYQSRISGRPEVLGELPSAELAADIAVPGEGQIGALFVIAGNPVLSGPGGRTLDAALETLDLMVSIDIYMSETAVHADYILPPCGPLEKDHYPLFLAPIAIRNFATYSPPLLPMEAGMKADWQIVAELSNAIQLAKGDEAEEIVTPRKMLEGMVEASTYDMTLDEVEAQENGVDLGPLFSQLPDRLNTTDKKLHCAPELIMKDLSRFRSSLDSRNVTDLLLIGRRHVRSNNSWLHNSHRLLKGPERCTLMIHPDDANLRGILDGQMTTVSNHIGRVELVAEITDDVMQGVVSIPHGYGHNRAGTKLSIAEAKPGVSINDLTDPARMDPLSGNAVLNGTPVEVAAVMA